MTGTPHEKFGFDTEFDAGGEIAFALPRPKRNFNAEEVEAARTAGFADGQRAALASIQAAQARALAEVAAACAQAMPLLAHVAHEHRVGAAALALACGKAMAGAALEQFPAAPVQAAVEALAREIESAPRLIVAANAELAPALQGALDDIARNVGFAGAVQVRTDRALGAHAFTLDFGDGAAAFDPAAAEARVTEALAAALASEGLHAEPLIPGAGH